VVRRSERTLRQLLYDAGFADFRREEVLGVAVTELPKEAPQPCAELRLVRSVGTAGTRFAAVDAEGQRGYLEIDTLLGDSGRFVRGRQLADIGNLFVEPEVRRRGVARWLLGTAARAGWSWPALICY
jgi:GNAT superfamily N-acetyltransferase